MIGKYVKVPNLWGPYLNDVFSVVELEMQAREAGCMRTVHAL